MGRVLKKKSGSKMVWRYMYKARSAVARSTTSWTPSLPSLLFLPHLSCLTLLSACLVLIPLLEASCCSMLPYRFDSGSLSDSPSDSLLEHQPHPPICFPAEHHKIVLPHHPPLSLSLHLPRNLAIRRLSKSHVLSLGLIHVKHHLAPHPDALQLLPI
ncbi:hypothetical protein EDB81DRAFT_408619 [Dactylonectria macrodidyma]|uniref:Uncharacterized protein n=1 Tax=Dactylonectria macrodidyma TaxID=307937 RepID=A0A9P9FAV8_9HYPO|nr:hypothetical protein EDB81DRAFT_408619 [Dactylonectria macrodidyma]